MSKSLLKAFVSFALATSLWSLPASSQTPTPSPLIPKCVGTLRTTEVEKLSIGQISSFGRELTISNRTHVMTFWPFDIDKRPRAMGRSMIGFALVRAREYGVQPLGLFIHTNQSSELSFVKDGNQIMISSYGDRPCPVRAILSLSEVGGFVLEEFYGEKVP